MAKTFEAVVRRRWLPPEYAVREVVAFERRFGKKHLALACHAALPLILTPELVNLIRINFLDGEDIPWIAESDLLLSPLCRPIQEGIYEVEPTIREVLLVELEDKFGWRIPFQLAEFLEFYLEKQPDWKLRPELTRTQKWIAQAYLDPDSTVREVKNYLLESLLQDNFILGSPGQSYISHLVEILLEPLERTNLWNEYQSFVEASRELAKLLTGEGKYSDKTLEYEAEDKLVLLSPVIKKFLEEELEQELEADYIETYKQPNAQLKTPDFFAYDAAWVRRHSVVRNLSNKIKGSYRLLILGGLTGIGKTALGERLAVELEDWFDGDWDKYLREDFDNEEQSFDFASVAARLLEKCGEPITPEERKDNQRLLNRLVRHLQENRYLVQIDSLERILEGNEKEGWSDFKDEWWVEFFQQWLKLDINESRIILTSDDLPAQIDLQRRYRNFSYCQLLSGLEKPEQLALFRKTGLDVESKAEEINYLERIGNAYEGHPLALRVIAGEIINEPFNKNVTAYWKKYGKEVEEVEKAIEEAQSGGAMASADDEINLHRFTRNLRNNVKTRLESAFNRLRKDSFNAYLLLCESSVYRCEVSEDFWLSHLEDWDVEKDEREIALDTLRDRFLVEEMVDESNLVMVRQHNLIRGLSLEHLRRLDDGENDGIIEIPPEGEFILAKLGIEPAFIRSIKDRSERTHYRAIINWLTKYKPDDVSNLDSLKGLLEAFYHLCEIEDWKTASKILVARLETPTKEELYSQLGTWGYYQQQISLCNLLLRKLDFNLDIKLLSALGNSYYALGDYSQAIDYLQQSLSIARQIKNPLEESNILSSLGKVYEALGEYQRAIAYLQQSLSIARENQSLPQESQALSNLAIVYYDMANYSQSLNYSEQSLVIARQIKNRQTEGVVLGNLGNIYLAQGEYQRAIDYYQQYLEIARETGDRFNEGRCIATLGNAYKALGEYQRAIDCYQQSLMIAKEIGDRRGEGLFLRSLGNAYRYLGNYPQAIEYYQRGLILLREIQEKRAEEDVLVSLGETYYFLKDYTKTIEYSQQALAIAQEIEDSLGEGKGNKNLGMAYQALEDYERALNCFQRHLEITQNIGAIAEQSQALSNLGSIYLDLNKYERAVECQQQSLQINRQTGDKYGEAKALLNLGNAFMQLEKYSEASEYLHISLDIFHKLGNRADEMIALTNLGDLQRLTNNFDLAGEYYDRALAISLELQSSQA